MMMLIIGKTPQRTWGALAQGFTLIEVMLSVTLLSLGLIAVNQTLLSSLSILNYSDTRFDADQAAQHKIFEIQDQALHHKQAPRAKEEGVLLRGRKTFSYLLQSVSVRGSQSLYEVRLRVQWLDAGKEKGLNRTFYARVPSIPQV